MSVPAELALGHRFSWGEAGLWAGAAAAIVFAHVAISLAFQSMGDLPPEQEATEEAMVVELAPLAFASSASVPSETISEEEVEHQAPDEVEPDLVEEDTAEATPELEQPEETPPVEETETVQQEIAEPIEDEVIEREIAETVEAEVVIPMPRPERVVEETPREKPRERTERKPERKVERKKIEAPTKRAEVKRDARAKSDSAVESRAAKAPTVNPARWDRAVQAAIARSARRLRGAKGSVSITFVVSSSGAITNARIARSSGDSSLDGAALRMVSSARVPPPPADLPGSSHSFTVPLSFR